jgi:hypothetical protein
MSSVPGNQPDPHPDCNAQAAPRRPSGLFFEAVLAFNRRQANGRRLTNRRRRPLVLVNTRPKAPAKQPQTAGP